MSYLRIFDFSAGRTARFSKIMGGYYEVKFLDDEKIIINKVHESYTKEVEIELISFARENISK